MRYVEYWVNYVKEMENKGIRRFVLRNDEMKLLKVVRGEK